MYKRGVREGRRGDCETVTRCLHIITAKMRLGGDSYAE